MRNTGFGFSSVFVLVIALWLQGCSKHDDPFKTHGFNSPDEFLRNPNVIGALSSAMPKFGIYAGLNPPVINGEYSMSQCYYTSRSSNPAIEIKIGQYLDGKLKFYSQDDEIILTAEKGNSSSFSLYSKGIRSFIAGNDRFFTVYSEILNSDGSTSVSIMSGEQLASGTIQMQNVIVATSNLSGGVRIGDWFASEGPLVP